MTFRLSSPGFAEGEMIPAKYTCDDTNVSPPLRWDNPPVGTQSFVLIMDDPDAPGGTFTHWVLYDIPGTQRELPENFAVGMQRELPENLAAGAFGVSGVNNFSRTGYGGPCPPRGPAHHYYFTLSALDIATVTLPPGASRRDVEAIIRGHVLARALLMGRYQRE